jgi:aminoglycoside phosphotransferase
VLSAISVPPPAIVDALGWGGAGGRSQEGVDGWDPYPAQGSDPSWPGRLWQVGDHLVRLADQGSPDQQRATIEAERQRSQWLAARAANVARVVVAVDNWIVSTVPDGAPGHQPELHTEPDRLPVALGLTLRRLHELDPASCPFTRPWSQVVGQLSEAIEAGRLDPARLPPPYDRYAPDRLIELVHLGRPATEDLVVTHGSPGLSNLFITSTDPDDTVDPAQGPIGVGGLHRLGVADRHGDLAIIHNQLNVAYGPEAVIGFYQGYGRTPDLVALDHHLMIDVLTTALTPAPVRTQ